MYLGERESRFQLSQKKKKKKSAKRRKINHSLFCEEQENRSKMYIFLVNKHTFWTQDSVPVVNGFAALLVCQLKLEKLLIKRKKRPNL